MPSILGKMIFLEMNCFVHYCYLPNLLGCEDNSECLTSFFGIITKQNVSVSPDIFKHDRNSVSTLN